MANSGTVTAGSAALASQYNNLRDDVLNVSTGHTHTGASENGAKVAATGVSSGTAALGAVLTADGAGAAAFLASSSGGILKYEEFTSSGSFVIPASASSSAIAVVEIVNGGVGGNSGDVRGSGTAAPGGHGGGGGSYGIWTYLMSTFGTAGGTVTVTIGAGGTGAVGGTEVAAPTSGGYPGITSFGSLALTHLSGSRVRSGFPAWLGLASSVSYTGDTNSAGTTVSGPTTISNLGEPVWLHGGNAGSALSDGSSRSAIDNVFGGGGGGGGGGVTSGNVAQAGGKGGKRYELYGQNLSGASGSFRITFGNGPAGGTAGAGAGGTPTAASGDGGGGGGGITSGNGGNGAAGAQPGGGGGGGGSTRTGGTAGSGGAGGAGRVRVWVIG